MIAAHKANGFLPAGIHSATWAEFVERFATTPRRMMLLTRVRVGLQAFAAAGASWAYVGGSFVSTKAAPKDVDILIEIAGLDVALVPEVLLDLSPTGRTVQQMMFGAEFFPDALIEGDSDLTMLEFFQRNRDGEAVGIVALDLSTV